MSDTYKKIPFRICPNCGHIEVVTPEEVKLLDKMRNYLNCRHNLFYICLTLGAKCPCEKWELKEDDQK